MILWASVDSDHVVLFPTLQLCKTFLPFCRIRRNFVRLPVGSGTFLSERLEQKQGIQSGFESLCVVLFLFHEFLSLIVNRLNVLVKV